MQWDNLKKAVAEVINANGVGAITGTNLQNVIKEVIDALGGTAGFKGFASLDTIPPTPDGLVFYFANEEGVYSNFGGIAVPLGLSVIRNNFDSQGGVEWEVLPLFTISDEISPNGTHAVSARALYLSFWSLGLFDYPEFDINKPYSTGDIIRYKGMLVEILQEISGGRELVEGIDYKRTSVSGKGGAQSDWDQKDDTKADFIKNKPLVPIIEPSEVLSIEENGKVVLSPNILLESPASVYTDEPDLIGPYNQTLGRAEEAIDRLNKAVMSLGDWKKGVDDKVAMVSTELNEAKGSSTTLGERIDGTEAEIANRIPYSDIKGSDVVDWGSEDSVVSPKAISQRIEAQLANVMSGNVVMKGKWSEIPSQGVIEPGYQYVYDSGQGPFGIPLEKGDIITAINRMANPSERENAANWVVAQSNFDYANIEGRVNKIEAEVKNARGNELSLEERLRKEERLVASLNTELAEARGANATLKDRLDTMASEALTYREGSDLNEIN